MRSNMDFFSRINVGSVIFVKSDPSRNWEIMPIKIDWLSLSISSMSSVSADAIISDALFGSFDFNSSTLEVNSIEYVALIIKISHKVGLESLSNTLPLYAHHRTS